MDEESAIEEQCIAVMQELEEAYERVKTWQIKPKAKEQVLNAIDKAYIFLKEADIQ